MMTVEGDRDGIPLTHSSARLSPFWVSGWAVNPSDLRARVPIELFVDRHLIVRRLATRPRSRLRSMYGGDGRHGYRIFLPPSALDGQEHHIVLVRADTNEVILETTSLCPAVPPNDAGAVGLVDKLAPQGVSGWALNLNDVYEPCDVDLWVDDAFVARYPADLEAPELALWENNVRHRFDIRIPNRFFDNDAHLIEVRHPDGTPLKAVTAGRVKLPADERANWRVVARINDGQVDATIAAEDRRAGAAVLTLWSGPAQLATKTFVAGEPFSFCLFDSAPLKIVAPLRIELDGEPVQVSGTDPFQGVVRIADVQREPGGVLVRLCLQPTVDVEVDLTFVADGSVLHRQKHAFTRTRRMGTFRIRTQAEPCDLEVHIGEPSDRTAVAALDTQSAKHPGTSPDEPAWTYIAPDAPAVRMMRGGLNVDADPFTYSGRWSVSHDTQAIKGWALRLDAPEEPVSVELLINGVVTASITPSTGVGSAERFEFAFDLRPLLESGAYAVAEVRTTMHTPLGKTSGVLVATGAGYSFGLIQTAWSDSILKISGWIHDHERPDSPVRLLLRSGDDLLAETLALRPREVEVSSNVAFSAVGFTFNCPVLLRDLSKLTIEPEGARQRWPVRIDDVGSASEANAKPAPAPDRSVSRRDVVIGSVDKVSMEQAQGWALAPSAPDAPIDMIMSLEGRPVSHTRTRSRREDVERKVGLQGYFGYSFEMPANVGWTGPTQVEVESVQGQSQIKRKTSRMPAFQTGCVAAHLSAPVEKRPLLSKRSRSASRLSAIVLNQNGALLLRDLFDSVLQHELEPVEWIVVDHLSTDGSAEVCAAYAELGLNIRFEKRPGNFSFSSSNNYGARIASGDIVLFINNDIILTEPIFGGLEQALADPEVGLVGMKLYDAVPGREINIIQHLGVFFDPVLVKDEFRAFEARLTPEVYDLTDNAVVTPATTGAVMAMRRVDFEAVGGFGEQYFYGYEDIDLCMKVGLDLGRSVVTLNTQGAIHHRGFTRADGKHQDPRRVLNRRLFTGAWGRALRKLCREELLSRPGFWSGHRPIIGFAVSEAHEATSAGDYFTALELGTALQAIAPVHVRYLPRDQWYDLSGVDILIVMVDGFDASRVKVCRPHVRLIAWARNWIDRWAEAPSLHAFDQLWAASDMAADYLSRATHGSAATVRIATNPERFAQGVAKQDLLSSYCFTGSRFGVPRDIEFALKPDAINGSGKVFGHNWTGHELEAISDGDRPYPDMPDIYASTKIVLDDANIATHRWGCVNSRVFDALGAGRLVLTNGASGAQEVFGDQLPTWSGKADLTTSLNSWLADDKARARRVESLQAEVLAKHTYAVRAKQVLDLLKLPAKTRIAIKNPAETARQHEWGDFHFANSLATALRKLGHVVRVDNREQWYGGLASADDIVIVLRGLIPYKPSLHQLNYLWIISHPEDITSKELQGYDRVYVASERYAPVVAATTSTPVEVLLQCTDGERFSISDREPQRDHHLLFVGNSRAVFRDSVKWAIEASLDIGLFGGGWGAYLPANMIHGGHIPNEVLGQVYAASDFVLCDHWAEMREHGFISNRIFDVLASGAEVISDDVLGLSDVITSGVHVYKTRAEFLSLCTSLEPEPFVHRAERARSILEHHSFDQRAATLARRMAIDLQGSGVPRVVSSNASATAA